MNIYFVFIGKIFLIFIFTFQGISRIILKKKKNHPKGYCKRSGFHRKCFNNILFFNILLCPVISFHNLHNNGYHKIVQIIKYVGQLYVKLAQLLWNSPTHFRKSPKIFCVLIVRNFYYL